MCTCWKNFPIQSGPSSSQRNEIQWINPYDANSLIESHAIIEQLSEEEEICVLGGGFVAVEVSGFLAGKYRERKITMIQRSNQLMKPIQDAHHAVMNIFKNSLPNVKVMLNSEIVSQNGSKSFIVKTKSNDTCCSTQHSSSTETQVGCSVCFICTGMKPQVDFLRDFFSKSLDSNGFICVNAHMQVEAMNSKDHHVMTPFLVHTNNNNNNNNTLKDSVITYSTRTHYDHIFAIGDATNVKETKLASHAHKHAKTVNTVLRQVLQSFPRSQLDTYTPRGYSRPQTVIIGPNHGLWIKGSTLLSNSSMVAYFKEKSQAMKGRVMASRGDGDGSINAAKEKEMERK